MAKRFPVFELHIRPMFRDIDIDHMRQHGLDLSDYNTVKGKARNILEWLKSSSPMPTRSTGGPWPPEWIALFERWMERFHQLERSTGKQYTLNSTGSRLELSCITTLPHFGSRCWFDLADMRQGSRVYELVLERAIPEPQPAPTPVTVREFFGARATTNGVWVLDAEGERFVVAGNSG